MVALQQMRHLMGYDALQVLNRLLGQFQIQPDAARLDVARAPLDIHRQYWFSPLTISRLDCRGCSLNLARWRLIQPSLPITAKRTASSVTARGAARLPPTVYRLFLLALWSDWRTRMSGIASIILSGIGTWLAWIGRPVSLWPFFTLSAICFSYACFNVWKDEHISLVALQEKMRAYPKLVAIQEGVETWIVGLHDKAPDGSPNGVFLCVRFRNDPAFSSPDSVARQVVSEIKFFNSDTSQYLCEASGRWMESIPPTLGAETPDTTDIQIGQTKQLCILVKPVPDWACYAVSNRPWTGDETIGHCCAETEIVARIRLRCAYVDQTWSLRFRNLGEKRGVKFIDIRAES